MHVYLVRHGETALNAQYIHQSPNTPLSAKGREQALSVAEYIRSVNPTILLSSEYTRALETARVIGMHTGLKPIVNGLFYEMERPSSLYHTSHFHPKTLWYIYQILRNRHNTSWRYEDAENIAMVTDRAQRALAFIESLADEHASVVVVSHTVFMNILIAKMCHDRALTLKEIFALAFGSGRLPNTGVVHLEYTPSSLIPRGKVCQWQKIDTV